MNNVLQQHLGGGQRLWHSRVMARRTGGGRARQRWRLLALALVLATALAPRAPADESGAVPSCTGRVGGPPGACGCVYDRLTGAPVAGAAVDAGGEAPGVTGDDGCFDAAGSYAGECAYVPGCGGPQPDCIVDCPFRISVQADGYEGTGFYGYFNTFPLRAARMFRRYCSECHRLGGRGGDKGPDLSTIGSARSRRFIHRYIEDPKSLYSPSKMSSFLAPEGPLSHQQIEDLARYLAAQRDGSAGHAGGAAPSSPGGGIAMTSFGMVGR